MDLPRDRGLDPARAAHFARLALDCVTREFPNKIAHVLASAADLHTPRHLTPAFYGCFDWHSAVHGHWLLARVARLFPREAFAAEARAALERNITDINIAGEVGYLSAPGRRGFERPYGLAWLLALAAELRLLDAPHVARVDRAAPHVARVDRAAPHVARVDRAAPDVARVDRAAPDVARVDRAAPRLAHVDRAAPRLAHVDRAAPDVARVDRAPALAEAMRPLEELAVEQLASWLPKLIRPDRSGQHPNTAFALGLALDYARAGGPKGFADLLTERARDYYLDDRLAPLAYEPSGEDFLSPALAEADLMRRVLAPAEFVTWLDALLPDLSPLEPQASPDRSDGKLAHLDGLNLSRAWMLRGIAGALPLDHARREQFLERSDSHAEAGLAAVTGEHYEGGHWLGTFAVYLLTS